MTTNAKNMGEIFETTVASGRFDTKGREIGYTVGFRDNGTEFYAWVQNARRAPKKVEGCDVWNDFGFAQRSKKFTSQKSAQTWAYSTARDRIANLVKTCRVLAK